jgi:hypothetical protein
MTNASNDNASSAHPPRANTAFAAPESRADAISQEEHPNPSRQTVAVCGGERVADTMTT